MLKVFAGCLFSCSLFVFTGCVMQGGESLDVEGHQEAVLESDSVLGEGGRLPGFPFVSADNEGPWNADEDYGLRASDSCRQVDIQALIETGRFSTGDLQRHVSAECRPALGTPMGVVIPRRGVRHIQVTGSLSLRASGDIRLESDLTAASISLRAYGNLVSIDGTRMIADRITLRSTRGNVGMSRIYTRPSNSRARISALTITARGDIDLSQARMLLAERISIRAGQNLIMFRARVMTNGRALLRAQRGDLVLERANLRGTSGSGSDYGSRYLVRSTGGDLILTKAKVSHADIYAASRVADPDSVPIIQLDRFRANQRGDFCLNGHELVLVDASTWDGADVQSDRGTRISGCSNPLRFDEIVAAADAEILEEESE